MPEGRESVPKILCENAIMTYSLQYKVNFFVITDLDSMYLGTDKVCPHTGPICHSGLTDLINNS